MQPNGLVCGTLRRSEAEQRLASLADEIRKTLGEYNVVIRRTAHIARHVGGLLAKAAAMMRSKDFSKWCLHEFDMARYTAHRYINIYRSWDVIESHPDFPNLTIMQMADVAKGKNPRDRSYKVAGKKFDLLFSVLVQRVRDAATEHPELQPLIADFERWKPILSKAGLIH